MHTCPGQEFITRDPDRMIYSVECGSCGNEVEFFHDDAKRPCDSCSETVQPDLETLMRFHNCATTCQSAYDCLGEEKYMQLYFLERRSQAEGKEEKEGITTKLAGEDAEVASRLDTLMQDNLARGYLLDMRNDLQEFSPEQQRMVYETLRDHVISR